MLGGPQNPILRLEKEKHFAFIENLTPIHKYAIP
jgi:hypothetical protein